MHLPPTSFRPPPLPEPAPVVQVAAQGPADWQQGRFRPPHIVLPVFPVDPAILPEEWRRIASGER